MHGNLHGKFPCSAYRQMCQLMSRLKAGEVYSISTADQPQLGLTCSSLQCPGFDLFTSRGSETRDPRLRFISIESSFLLFSEYLNALTCHKFTVHAYSVSDGGDECATYMCDMSSMDLTAVKFPLIYKRNIHL